MLSSTFTSTLRSPVVPSPTLRKSPHQYHSMGLTLPLFSYSYALFCTAERANPFRFIFFRALCGKHPGWGIPSFLATSAHCARPDLIGALKPIRAFGPLAPDRRRSFTEPRKAPNPLRIRTYAKYTRNPFTMNTSKTQHLKPFRMNTYEKTGRGVAQTSVYAPCPVYPSGQTASATVPPRVPPRAPAPSVHFVVTSLRHHIAAPLPHRISLGPRRSTHHSLFTTHSRSPFDKAPCLV
jgi:hypothetical protein